MDDEGRPDRISVDTQLWHDEKAKHAEMKSSYFKLKIASICLMCVTIVGVFHHFAGPWVIVTERDRPVPQAIPAIDPDVLCRAVADFKESHHVQDGWSPVTVLGWGYSMLAIDYEKKWDEKIRLEVRRVIK